MTHDFEYISYTEADRIAILENRAAELERRLFAALPPDGTAGWGNVATPQDAGAAASPGAPAAPGGMATFRHADAPSGGSAASSRRSSSAALFSRMAILSASL